MIERGDRTVKKSEIYQIAMEAVVNTSHLLASVRVEIIDQLLTDQRLAAFNEEALEPLPEEDEL